MQESGSSEERRRRERVRFFWPLWFGYEPTGPLVRAQAVDLSPEVVGCTVEGHACPRVGDHVLTRFSFPVTGSEQFSMDSYHDWSEVMRVEPVHADKYRVALRLRAPVTLEAELGETTEVTELAAVPVD